MRLVTRKAATLLEMLLAVAVLSMMMAGLTTAMLAGRAAWSACEASKEVQFEVRNALWRLSRDIRQAQVVSLDSTSTALSFVFIHPQDGNVTYSWTSASTQLVRTVASVPKVVAKNISLAYLVNNNNVMDVTVTASYTAPETQKTQTLTLKEKVSCLN